MAISVSRRTTLCALGFLAFVVAWWLWPTEKRAVSAAIDRLRGSAEAADWEGFLDGVSRGYNHEGTTYADLGAMGQPLAKMLGPCTIYILNERITVQGGRAIVNLVFMVTASGQSARFRGTGKMTWQLTFRKEKGHWLLVRATPVKLPYVRHNASTVRELRQYLGI